METENSRELLRQYAVVRILDIPYHVDKPFTYYLTPEQSGTASVGCFVMVPFGVSNRKVMGIVTELQSQSDLPAEFPFDRCKPIAKVVSGEFVLNEELLGLCRYMKEMTFCSFGDAAKAVIPTGALRRIHELYVFPTEHEQRAKAEAYLASLADPSSLERDILSLLLKKSAVRREKIAETFGADAVKCADVMVKKGLLDRTYRLSDSENAVYQMYVSSPIPAEDIRGMLAGNEELRAKYGYRHKSDAYNAVMQRIAAADGEELQVNTLDTQDVIGSTALRVLAKEGFLTVRREQVFRNPYESAYQAKPKDDNILSEEQQGAFDQLSALYRTHEPKAALLHGVTGSGKTRVIKAMMDEVLADGRQVIMLVPEISLTPQSVSIFCSYYGNRVALLHSALSAGERLDVWRRVKRGEVDIVIGTRSAVFVPFERLGMIVIDEEQEHTYKSDSNPKYHARDAARFRCAHSKALMLLASATPSLESYYKAERGIYSLITLKNRYGNARLPEVIMADMHGETLNGSGDTPLGRILSAALSKTKEKNEQAILFINRRGYHKYVSCLSCKNPVMCPHCSVPMTLHKKSGMTATDTVIDPTQPQGTIGGILVCHYCGTHVRTPQVCPSCQAPHLHAFGYGTQRAEDDLEKRFPDIRTQRMDMDTTKEKFSHDLILKSFRNKTFDVLLGTQMVTKGHDFPDVTLVGILSADAMLYQDDYRASEKAFSLITQVIGRAGRGDKPGRAIIQTYSPDNEILKLAAAQDYETFYRGAIRMREAMVFPPFCEIVLLSLSSSEEVEVMNAAAKIASRLRELIAPGGEYHDVQMAVFGPFEAQVYKVNEKFRMRMILKCRLNRRTRALLDQIMTDSYTVCAGRVAVSIDVNPSNL